MRGWVLKVLTDAVFQFFCFANIDHLLALVHHQIDTGFERQTVRLFPQFFKSHSDTPNRKTASNSAMPNLRQFCSCSDNDSDGQLFCQCFNCFLFIGTLCNQGDDRPFGKAK